MVQSSKVTFFFGVILFSALLNDSTSHARPDISIHGNKEESIINEKEASDKEMNKITIADTKTDRFKERERMPSSHDTFARFKYKTRDADDQRQVSGNSRLRNRQNFSTARELLNGDLIHGKQRLLEERDEIFKFLNKDYHYKARRRTPINN